MNILLLCDDALNLILKLSQNCYCAIVCKKWYDLLLLSSNVCLKCNKITKIHDMELWGNDNISECHTNPLFIKHNTKIGFVTDYGQCFSDTIKILKNLSEFIYIYNDLSKLIIKIENPNNHILATLNLPKRLTRNEYLSKLNNNQSSIFVKLNASDFYDSVENSPTTNLTTFNSTKLYFENNNNDNYLKVNAAYSKTKLFKSLKISDDEMQKFNTPNNHNIPSIFDIPSNYEQKLNLNKNDFEILRTLPEYLTDIKIFINDNKHAITICSVTTIGNLRLEFDS